MMFSKDNSSINITFLYPIELHPETIHEHRRHLQEMCLTHQEEEPVK